MTRYYSKRKICNCGFDTFSKTAWRKHVLDEHSQTQTTLGVDGS